MAITIPELPNADYNKEIRLWITSNYSYLAQGVGEFVDTAELSRIKNPVILLQDMETNRTKKTTLEDFIAHLEARIMTKTIPAAPPTRLIYANGDVVVNGTVVTDGDVVDVPWYLKANNKIRKIRKKKLEARQEEPETKISNLAQEVFESATIIAPQWFKGVTPYRGIIEEIKLRVKEELDEEESRESTQETLQEALELLYQISLADRLPDTLQQELESFLWRHYDRE